MNIVDRLLTREEIDALELEVTRAREAGDSEAVSAIAARIGRLEAALAKARQNNVRLLNRTPGYTRAA